MPTTRKIALTGPESTGKTWLAQRLAGHFSGIWVPEQARQYLTELSRPYTLDDVVRIAHAQAEAEDEALSQGAKWVFCDTDLLVCQIWAEKRFGHCPPELKTLYQHQPYELHLLCRPDLPWEPDPLREAPDLHEREALFTAYHDALASDRRPFRIVEGAAPLRWPNALAQLTEHFGSLPKDH
jgi:NadR type nicotinamide-nucleotide adenylyltransferase